MNDPKQQASGQSGESAGDIGGGRAERDAGGVDSDAPPSNRASEKCKEDPSFQVIWQGVDFLEISFSGRVRAEAAAQLNALKLQAQSSELREQAHAQILLADQVFAVHDRGGGRFFPYVVSNACFYLKIGNARDSKLPAIFGQVRSEYLFRAGAFQALQELRRIVEGVADVESGETVSRIDLTADFTVDADIEQFARKSWVSRGSNASTHSVGDQFSGLTFGLGGAISARLYDKELEIRLQSKKFYLFDTWLNNEWNPLSTPWRLEYQLRRPVLQRFDLRSLNDVLAARATLWQYLTRE